jgi:PAS domain S-box-containing protein
MIDSFAAGHDNYLKRYRDTGEARVIGTAGRNVPAKRKDLTTFPAALTVEEGYADGERFFLANIQDTSLVEGTIFIDGYGTIQNIDAGLSQLLGYKKETAVGKNIKNLMPVPYCDYHDMYLERYRRTKVANVLRSTEGRIFPALHADGSQVMIRALITRADSGETGSNMLFKGSIKRASTGISGLSGGRRGFLESYELEMNKAGIIVKLNRKILTMLGHPQDRPISDFIGQPIEVLIPALPDRPSQAKSVWFTRALKSPDLNFYLIACNKNFTLLPITFCLDERPDGAIRMRIRDLSELDALLTIDEIGNVLKMNEDAFMLLGFEPDETIGRNIKYIQAQEVADQHDYYLQRYKDTGVARVVGIARTVDTIHRDTSMFPVEIQVTEQIKPDGSKNFIGRLRHRKIEERCEKDIITRYVVNTKALGTTLSSMTASAADSGALQSSASVGSDGRRMKFKGSKKGSSKGSSKISGGLNESGVGAGYMDDDQHSRLSNSLNASSSHGSSGSHGSSSVSSNTKFQALLTKLKFIKNSSKEDPSLSQFGTILNVILAVYVIFFAIGLIVTNTIQTPIPYYILMQNINNMDVVINEVITAARLMELVEDPDIIVSKCSWDEEHATEERPLCPWIASGINAAKVRNESFNNGSAHLVTIDGATDYGYVPQYTLEWMLGNYSAEMVYRYNTLKDEYTKIRVPGDVFDNVIQGEFEVKRFIHGDWKAPEPAKMITFWNVLGVLSASIDSLKAVKKIDEASQRDWAFIIANRYNFINMVKKMDDMIPTQATLAINNNMIFHLIMAIVSIILGIVYYVFNDPRPPSYF